MGKLKDENEFSEDYFELEFSDLPVDDEDVNSSAFAKQSILLLAKAHAVEGVLIAQSTRLLVLARAWLLTDVSPTKVKERSETTEFELEITALPPDVGAVLASARPPALLTGYVGQLANWTTRMRFAPRLRIWRLALAVCTVFLVFLLAISSIPSARDWAYGLLVYPTTTSTGKIVSLPGLRYVLIQQGGRWSVVAAGTPVASSQKGQVVARSQGSEIIVQDNKNLILSPGPVPQGNACSANPVVDKSQSVGSFPVLVKGFEGPVATVHLGDVGVYTPDFLDSFGWVVPLEVSIDPNYTGFVTLTGSNQFDSSTLLFSFPGRPNQMTTITLGSQRYAAPLDPTVTIGTGKSRWDILMYVPAAGCFYLNAAWAGGQWSANFAAGE